VHVDDRAAFLERRAHLAADALDLLFQVLPWTSLRITPGTVAWLAPAQRSHYDVSLRPELPALLLLRLIRGIADELERRYASTGGFPAAADSAREPGAQAARRARWGASQAWVLRSAESMAHHSMGS
jgi:hypothetical protein